MRAYILHLIILLLFYTANAQENYYISPNGDDNNPGNVNNPWKTIQYGIDKASSGDTLNLETGTFNEKINITKQIYIRNKTGNMPVISGNNITSQNPIILISSQSNIVIDSLEIAFNIQNDAQGIMIEGTGNNILIQNCRIHDIHFSSDPNAAVNENTNAQGIIIYGNNANSPISGLKIINNELFNCRLGYSEGIAVNGNVEGFQISDNKVHDLTNIGIDIVGHEGTCPNPALDQARNGLVKNNIISNCISNYATSGGIYVDGGKKTVIEKNTSYQNGYGIEVGCENKGYETDSIIVRNNIIYNNQTAGIALGGFDYPNLTGKVKNVKITNNTLYKNDNTNSGTGEFYITYSEYSKIENNIIYMSSQNKMCSASCSQPSISFDYNVFFSDNQPSVFESDWNGYSYTGLESFKSGTSLNLKSKIGDPKFIKPGIYEPDFHLTKNSAAIEAGNPNYIPESGETDIDGENRLYGTIDCGADEYYSQNPVNESDNQSIVLLYPNPASDYIFVSGNQDSRVFIYNSLGIMVISSMVNVKIDLGDLPAGLYFVKIGDKSKKIIKKD